MRFAVTQEEMRQIDDYMIRKMKIPGIVLMENAAMAVADFIMQKFPSGSVAVFCGHGNNGGDGFAVARGLLTNGYDVQVFLVGDILTISGDARTNYEFFEALGERFTQVRNNYELGQAEHFAACADVIVDALFGTGIAREIEGLHLETLELINRLSGYKVSVDIPSGIAGDTGAVMGAAVHADATVTFQYPKIGHYLYPGREYRGELVVARIGVDMGCPVLDKLAVRAVTQDDCGITLSARCPNTNKGDYGRLLIVAGSTGMAGAAVLCSRAAVRSGAGLTTLASVENVVRVMQASVPEVVCKLLPGQASISGSAAADADRLIGNATALAVGPGLSDNHETLEFVCHMVSTHQIPKVFDADALNCIAKRAEVLQQKQGDVILTPHPKEFSRLADMDVDNILRNPIAAAREFIEKYDVTVVLKGAVTVVANRESGITLVAAGSPGMAKGGSGDVLTGIIASLCAQGHQAYEAAVLGVLVNGIAGFMAAQEAGEYAMTASDTIGMIGKAMDSLKDGKAVLPDRSANHSGNAGKDNKVLYKPSGKVCSQPYEDTYKAEESQKRSSEARFADEPITLGTEGLEEHFDFLAADDEPASTLRADDDNSFGDRMDTRMRYGMPD